MYFVGAVQSENEFERSDPLTLPLLPMKPLLLQDFHQAPVVRKVDDTIYYTT